MEIEDADWWEFADFVGYDDYTYLQVTIIIDGEDEE